MALKLVGTRGLALELFLKRTFVAGGVVDSYHLGVWFPSGVHIGQSLGWRGKKLHCCKLGVVVW